MSAHSSQPHDVYRPSAMKDQWNYRDKRLFSVCRKLWNPWHRICRAPHQIYYWIQTFLILRNLHSPLSRYQNINQTGKYEAIQSSSTTDLRSKQLWLVHWLRPFARRYYVSCFYTESLESSSRRFTVIVTLFILYKRISSCITLPLDLSFVRERLF